MDFSVNLLLVLFSRSYQFLKFNFKFQVVIGAKDLGDPSQESENSATVVVTVDRNKNRPEFVDPETYEKTIQETLGGGNEVLRINVRDKDTQEPFNDIRLSVIGDDSAPSFFEINPEGQVKIRNEANLASDRLTDYTVSTDNINSMIFYLEYVIIINLR